MAKRGLCFRCAFIGKQYLLELPMIVPTSLAYTFPSAFRHGIRIVDTLPQTRERFTIMASEALDLVAGSDPVRFGRVRAQIRTIVDLSAIVMSTYAAALWLCSVNLRSFEKRDDIPGTVRLLASIFIYEATFGYLLRQGALRTRGNRDRFDFLCRLEAQRFMQRLGMSSTPWDDERSWQLSPGERLRIGWADYNAAEREARDADSTRKDH